MNAWGLTPFGRMDAMEWAISSRPLYRTSHGLWGFYLTHSLRWMRTPGRYCAEFESDRAYSKRQPVFAGCWKREYHACHTVPSLPVPFDMDLWRGKLLTTEHLPPDGNAGGKHNCQARKWIGQNSPKRGASLHGGYAKLPRSIHNLSTTS